MNVVYDPMVTRMADHLPRLAMFAIGIGVLLLSFSIFDRVLPNLEQPGPRFERASAFLHQRYAMFLFGLIVTGMTLSVSLSLTILVPLTLKGYVKRDNIIPYVMGANIATWIDTLFAALLLDQPRAFTIVFVEMVTGATVSLIGAGAVLRAVQAADPAASRTWRRATGAGSRCSWARCSWCRRCCCWCELVRLRNVGIARLLVRRARTYDVDMTIEQVAQTSPMEPPQPHRTSTDRAALGAPFATWVADASVELLHSTRSVGRCWRASPRAAHCSAVASVTASQ